MRPLPTRDRAQMAAIIDALDTVRLGAANALDGVFEEMRTLLEVEWLLAYRVAERTSGFDIALYHCSTVQDAGSLGRAMSRFFARAPNRFALYDTLRPELGQRDRVVEPQRWAPPAAFDEMPMQRELFLPLRLDRHRHLRALLCDEGALLAWFGAMHPGGFDGRQRRIMTALAPSVRRRLAVERRVAGLPVRERALDAALEAVGAPAFVLTARGTIEIANAAARAMLERDHRGVVAALRDAIARRPCALRIELTPLRADAAPVGWLAIVRTGTPDARVAERVATAASRWALTRRQAQLLELVVRGMPTSTISAVLRIAERTVEFHVTALFDRAGVSSRAALVAAVLAP